MQRLTVSLINVMEEFSFLARCVKQDENSDKENKV
jgi:hypothetical protein